MITVGESDLVCSVFEAEDKFILASGHQAVAVEVSRNDSFEGTLLYVPGIHFKELKVK